MVISLHILHQNGSKLCAPHANEETRSPFETPRTVVNA